MDVQNTKRKGFEKRRTDEPHEPGKADEIDASRTQRLDDGPIVGVAVRMFARGENDRFEPGFSGALQARGVRAAADNQSHSGIQPAFTDRIDN